MQFTRPKYVFFRPTGELLLTLTDAKAINPLVELTTDESTLNDMGFFRMDATPIPECGKYQYVQEIQPTYSEGRYQRCYEIVNMFPAAIIGRNDRVISIEDQIEQYETLRCKRLRSELKDATLAAHEERLKQGFHIEHEGTTHRLNLDPMSYMELVAASYSEAAEVSLPSDQEFLVTPAQAKDILKRVSAQVQLCTREKMSRLKQLTDATTYEDLQALQR